MIAIRAGRAAQDQEHAKDQRDGDRKEEPACPKVEVITVDVPCIHEHAKKDYCSTRTTRWLSIIR